MVTFRPGIGTSEPEDFHETNIPFFRKNIQNKGGHISGTIGPDLSKDPLIHESFPPMGEQKRAHEGSQSEAPLKEQSMDSMPREDSEEGQKVRPKMSDAPYQPPPKMNDVGGAYNNVQ
jgi:hypothetical protein